MSSELDLQTIQSHYDRIEPVMEELGEIEGYPTIGLNDYSGWYIRRDHDDFELIDEGFEQEARCATLSRDYETIQDRIERALYAVTTYKSREAFMEWEPCTIEDGSTSWKTDRPTPGYGDLRGVMVWGDIDLADELKPQRGDLDEETQAVIEEALEAYIDEYARLYGTRDAVYALDSVGGSYVMGAPAATVPIAELFDDDADARERVVEAFVDRSNEWLKEAQERVEQRVEGASDVIDPDWVNNCNRQYKAPLSLHTDHDAVVVPIDTDSPTYDLVRFADVDDGLIETASRWARDLTSAEYEKHAEALVKHLWPDEYEANESWESALKTWVESEREREERREEALQRARERRRERKAKMGGSVEGAPVTPFISDVFDGLNSLPIEDVADKTIVHQWTDRASGKSDNSGDGKRAFIPTWGPNADSGNANFVDLNKGVWIDTGDDYSGGPVKMALIAEENWNRGKTPSGEDWRRGVEHLREMGYEIPVWTPDANSQNSDGEEYDQMPYWSVRKAAVALGVLPEDAFIRAEGTNGTYLKFPGKETYNHALAAIEDAGLEHGREYYTDDGSRPDGLDEGTSDVDSTTDEAEPSESDSESDDRSVHTGIRGAHSELDVKDGGYGYWHTNYETGETWFERVTNFTIEVDSFLFDDGDRIIDMTVIPATGEDPYDLKVETKVFNDARRFRDNVVTGLTTTFEGGASDLNELRKLVGSQDAPIRTGTHHMGLHPDAGEFVTPEGVLTGDGWTDGPETDYIEREISAERAWSLTPDQNADYDPQHVAEILELTPKSRFSERFLPVLGWVYTAPLRPYVQKWEGQFNTLHVTGETGAGKSSTLSVLWQLIGMDGEPMACDDTKFALLTSMASTNSIPMWFDEYKPGDMKDWEVDRFQSLMRSTTRGGIATRGNADKSTEEYELKAPIMISGEQSIQGPAEERRSIQTRFREGVKEPGSPTKKAFAHLTGMAYDAGDETREPEGYDLEQHALAYHQFVLRQDPGELKRLWRESRDYVRELLAENDITGVDDLPRQGVQTIHFGMTLYSRFAEKMAEEAGIDTEGLELPTSDELNDALLYIAKQFGDDGGRKSHLDQFIELTARAATEDYLEEGKHFKFVNEGSPDEELALKLSSVHDRVSKYVRDHGLDSADLLNNASDYRDRMREAADDTGSYVTTHSQYTPPLSRCARVNTRTAEAGCEFSRLAFGAEPRDEEEESSERSDDDDGPSAYGARPLTDVASDPTGYATVTVKILTTEQPDHDDAPAMKATVKDRTTAIDVVSWNDPDALPENGSVVIENAEVGKYDGTVQLTIRSGVTEITEIQTGVGYTEGEPSDEDQGQLDETPTEAASLTEAASDGGTPDAGMPRGDQPEGDAESPVPGDAEGLLADARCLQELLKQRGVPLEEGDIVVEASVERDLMEPERAKMALEYATERKGMIVETDDGYVPT